MKSGIRGFIKIYCYHDLSILGFTVKPKVYGPSLRSVVYRRPTVISVENYPNLNFELNLTFLNTKMTDKFLITVVLIFPNNYDRLFFKFAKKKDSKSCFRQTVKRFNNVLAIVETGKIIMIQR